jgi:hypothetical protein
MGINKLARHKDRKKAGKGHHYTVNSDSINKKKCERPFLKTNRTKQRFFQKYEYVKAPNSSALPWQ